MCSARAGSRARTPSSEMSELQTLLFAAAAAAAFTFQLLTLCCVHMAVNSLCIQVVQLFGGLFSARSDLVRRI